MPWSRQHGQVERVDQRARRDHHHTDRIPAVARGMPSLDATQVPQRPPQAIRWRRPAARTRPLDPREPPRSRVPRPRDILVPHVEAFCDPRGLRQDGGASPPHDPDAPRTLELVPAIETTSALSSRTSMAIHAAACTASTWTSALQAARTRAMSGARSATVPTSLLASWSETRHVRSVSASSSASGSTRPYRSTATATTSKPNFSSPRQVSRPRDAPPLVRCGAHAFRPTRHLDGELIVRATE